MPNNDFVCGQMAAVGIRRYRRERRNLEFVERRHTALTPGVMVWGTICFDIRSPFVFVSGILNAHRYIFIMSWNRC
jgi:hypothetical protein